MIFLVVLLLPSHRSPTVPYLTFLVDKGRHLVQLGWYVASAAHRPRHIAAICAALTASLSCYQDEGCAESDKHSPQWLDTGLGKDPAQIPVQLVDKAIGNFGTSLHPVRTSILGN